MSLTFDTAFDRLIGMKVNLRKIPKIAVTGQQA
jgi:hypothetical protein